MSGGHPRDPRAAGTDALALLAGTSGPRDQLAVVSAYMADGQLEGLVPLWQALARATGVLAGGSERRLGEVFLEERELSDEAWLTYDALAYVDAQRRGDAATAAAVVRRYLTGDARPARCARFTARLIAVGRRMSALAADA